MPQATVAASASGRPLARKTSVRKDLSDAPENRRVASGSVLVSNWNTFWGQPHSSDHNKFVVQSMNHALMPDPCKGCPDFDRHAHSCLGTDRDFGPIDDQTDHRLP